MTRAAAGVGLFASLLIGPVAASAQSAAPLPPCRVSDDPAYALTREAPVQVGGSPMFGAARQRRYLSGLRGPAGEVLRFERKGSTGDPDAGLLDMYEVSYDGLARPIVLYLDFYHFTDTLLAPRGFSCGGGFELGLPPPDPFMAQEQLLELAVAMGAEKGFVAPPIELGTPPAVMIVDAFRRLSGAARLAARAGKPLDPKSLPAPLALPRTAVIAYPVTCGDRRMAPAAVGLSDPQGRTAQPASATTSLNEISDLAPGASVPEGSLAGVFTVPSLQPGLAVTVSYREPACPDRPPMATHPVTGTGARLLESGMPKRPAGDAAIGRWIALQALVDEVGSFRVVRPLGGPSDLVKAAVEAVAGWKAEPSRINGSPVPTPVVLQVVFQKAADRDD